MYGQHLKSKPGGHCANSGHADTHKGKRNHKTNFLLGVTLMLIGCLMVSIILLVFHVEKQFAIERNSRKIMSNRIDALSDEIEQLKRNVAGHIKQLKMNVAGHIRQLKEDVAEIDIQLLQKSITAEPNQTVPIMARSGMMSPASADQVASHMIPSLQHTSKVGRQMADYSEILNTDSGSTPASLPSNSSLLQDLLARHQPISQKNEEKQQQPAASLASRNISKRSQRHSRSVISEYVDNADENVKLPDEKPKHVPIKESEMVRSNKDSGYSKPRIARSASTFMDTWESGKNFVNNAMKNYNFGSFNIGSQKEVRSASNSDLSWPAAHFNSRDMSSQLRKSNDDCPREIQNNKQKWEASEDPGRAHFDLKNNENITVKNDGLYFVYSQIFFYTDKSVFGYLIKKENQNEIQDVLQCSIHTPTNRPSSGSGTTCFTAGLVNLRANDVLRLEIFAESGKCVRWGPGKSFIGLYKLPQDSSAS